MKVGERLIEAAEANVALERDTEVNRIRAGLAMQGASHCGSCGDEIEAERRRAMPSATRCIDCQGRHERSARRRAA